LFGALAFGRLHYILPFRPSQADFPSNHRLLTADLQAHTLFPAFLEETVKPGSRR